MAKTAMPSNSAYAIRSNITGVQALDSPGVTPIKPLPFSPSQFLNSPTFNLSYDINLPASTPVRKHSQKVKKKNKQTNIPHEQENMQISVFWNP